MKNKILSISVVIPMYNSHESVVRALESVNNQTAIKYIKEIIVVNDGSTDSSMEVVEKYKEHSKITINLYSQKNSGVSFSRNRGMDMATGEWIALLDSDDMWLSNKIEKQIAIINNNPEIDFLSGNMNSRETKILFTKITELYKVSIKDICIKMVSQPSTVIFKKRIYTEIGGFDVNQRYAEDGNYFLKICLNYNYYHYPEQVINYGYEKIGFGETGLSANLEGMHKGNIKNLKYMRKVKAISIKFYFLMRVFYYLKYLRRIVLTKSRKTREINND